MKRIRVLFARVGKLLTTHGMARPSRRRSRSSLLVRPESLEIRQLMTADVGATFSTAEDLGAIRNTPIRVNESISVATDVDLYQFTVIAGQSVGFDIDTVENGPPGLGSYLRVFNSQGYELAANNDRPAPGDPSPGEGAGSDGFDSYIFYTFSDSGTYYVGVSNWQHRSYNPDNGMTALGGDSRWLTGDFSLELTSSISIVNPLDVAAKKDGSLVITYSLDTNEPVSTTVSVGLFWAKGPTGPDALPTTPYVSAPGNAFFTYQIPRGQASGTFTFTVPASNVTVAPEQTTHLLVVANPERNLLATISTPEVFAERIHTEPLSAIQLKQLLPRLSSTEAARLVGPLNKMMSDYGIVSLEQRAMFLAQIGWESADLTTWIEDGSRSYFINRYWVARGQWSGLGSSIPTASGLTLRIPASVSAPLTKEFKLYFAQGSTLKNNATVLRTVEFRKSNGYYTAQFAGAVPPKLTTHLLIVDPSASNKVVSAIRNKLGNWSPSDAADFRGRGPMQLTGRYNFQRFATYSNHPAIMTDPSRVSDRLNPSIGLASAGWYWKKGNPRGTDLNEIAIQHTGISPGSFNHSVTPIINGGYNHEQQRLTKYFTIRSAMIEF